MFIKGNPASPTHKPDCHLYKWEICDSAKFQSNKQINTINILHYQKNKEKFISDTCIMIIKATQK